MVNAVWPITLAREPVITCDDWNVGETGGWTDKVSCPPRTVNPLLSESTSVPVVRVTARAPAGAAGSMFSRAVALVAELTVRDTTVIPLPKFDVVVP